MTIDEARNILIAVCKGVEIKGYFHIENNDLVIKALETAIDALKVYESVARNAD